MKKLNLLLGTRNGNGGSLGLEKILIESKQKSYHVAYCIQVPKKHLLL